MSTVKVEPQLTGGLGLNDGQPGEPWCFDKSLLSYKKWKICDLDLKIQKNKGRGPRQREKLTYFTMASNNSKYALMSKRLVKHQFYIFW